MTAEDIGTGTQAGMSRRLALRATAVAGVGIPLLAACGDDGDDGDEASGGSESAAASETPSGGGSFATTADIPEGGGAIFADEGVVVTQPAAGEFKGFTNICTHQGCPVSDVTETINCSCHGSQYSLEDGSPQAGPATEALAEVEISVDGESISLA